MRRVLIGLACAALTLLSGCAAQRELMREAQTPEEEIFALFGTFVVYEELGAQIVTDQATPEGVKSTIRKLDATAKPAADAMQDAAREVVKIKSQLAAGGTPTQKLEIANSNMLEWAAEAKPKIVALQCAINPKQAVCKKE